MALGRRAAAAAAAYTLIDISGLDKEDQKAIIEDAANGGGEYGVRVVEESINGGASAPVYGVYKDGPDADRWAATKKELGVSSSEIDDADIAAAGVEIADPRREAAIREAAAQMVAAEADRIRAGEDSELAEILGKDVVAALRDRGAATTASRTDVDSTNIVDTTLSRDATNVGGEDNADDKSEDEAKAKAKTARNRSPR